MILFRDAINFSKYFVFLKKKPVIIYRVIRNYILIRFFKLSVPCSAEFAVTYSCQASCKKCSCSSLVSRERPEVSILQIESIIKKLKRSNVFLLNITGGEPLLAPELMSIIKISSKEGMLTSLSSNGNLVNKTVVAGLKKAGLDVLQLSLDSPYPKEHDLLRGLEGNFNAVLHAAQAARKAGLIVLINVVLTHSIINSPRLEELVRLIKGLGCFFSVILPVNYARLDDPGFSLNDKDKKVIKEMFKLSFVKTDLQTSFSRYGCPAGSEKLYINPYGDVYPCPFRHINYGNILEEDLDIIMSRMRAKRYYSCIGFEAKEGFSENIIC